MIKNLVIPGQGQNSTWLKNVSNYLKGNEIISHTYDFWVNGVTKSSDEDQTQLEIKKALSIYRGNTISVITCKSLGCILGLNIALHSDWKELYLFGLPTQFNIDSLLGKLDLSNRKVYIFSNLSDPVSDPSMLRDMKNKYPSLYLTFFDNDAGHNYDQVKEYFNSSIETK